MQPTPEDRRDAGIALLTSRLPDWQDYVDPTTVNMRHTDDCVYGQVGQYHPALAVHRLCARKQSRFSVFYRACMDFLQIDINSTTGYPAPEVIAIGAEPDVRNGEKYTPLTELWVDYLVGEPEDL